MISLEKSLRAFGTPEFASVLKLELAQLAIHQLPLQEGLSVGSYVIDAPVTFVNISAVDAGETIGVQAGVFYQGMIAGCSCADDPTPVGETNEYCEIRLDIDKLTALTRVALLE
jgi:hypothetical protein